MSVPVIAECNIDGHSNISSTSSTITARCRTSGFSLLKNHYRSSRNAVKIVFDAKDMQRKEGDVFYVTASDLSKYVTDIFGDDISLESFVSETFQFRFAVENHKRVPIKAVQVVSFKSQYMAMSPMSLKPDSVTIYGEPFHLESIDVVYTRTISLQNLHSSAHGIVKIDKIAGVRMSEVETSYSIDVTRFVEISSECPITVRNVPPSKKVSVYPSVAKAIFKCAFPLSNDPTDVVRFYIDYADFEKSISGKCVARSTKIPDGVLEYSLDPEIFDCVEEGR